MHQIKNFLFLCRSPPGDEVWVSDPEGTFDAMAKLSQATDFLLLAAGTGETNKQHVHVHASVHVHVCITACIHACKGG